MSCAACPPIAWTGWAMVVRCGWKTSAQGNVVQIWGGTGTQPAHDRHDGFHEFADKEPGIKNLLDTQ